MAKREPYFDDTAADDAVLFFEKFVRHVKGEWAGQPFELDDWQRDEVVRPLFGWKQYEGGPRLYRRCYVEIPRKNGKSTLGAGIALYLLLADQEPGAEVYSAAADTKQAAIVFDVAKAMVEQTEALRKRCKLYRRSITVPGTASSYHVLSADAFTKHGLNAHGVIFDELHAQKSRDLWDVLTTSTGSRRQPLVFAITTAGIFDPESICWEIHDYAEKVRDGIIEDETFLPVIYAAEKDEDWTAPEVWRAANPGLGVTVKEDYLERECERAKEVPAAQNTFRRLHLNQWTEQATRWLDMDVWDENEGHLDEAALIGEPCWGGLDLSSTTDLSALSLVFQVEGEYHTVMRYWLPEEALHKRSRRDRVPYDAWERDGWITVTPGNVIDYDQIRADIGELDDRYPIQELAFDPWNATQLSTQLAEQDGIEMVKHRQGFASMASPTRELQKVVTGRTLVHGAHPVLRWNASNVAVKEDAAGNLKPAKDKSSERIDGIVALIMALGRASVSEKPGPSVYETRGPLVFG